MARRSEQLSREEVAEAIKYFAEHTGGKDHTCSVCGTSSWNMTDTLVSIPVFRQVLSRSYPAVAISCNNCGHLQFFHLAVVLPEIMKELRAEEDEQRSKKKEKSNG